MGNKNSGREYKKLQAKNDFWIPGSNDVQKNRK